MRAILVLSIALLVPLAGCLHNVVPAGIPKSDLDAAGYTLKDSKSETRAGLAKVETRQYERTDLATGGFATLVVATITEVPLLTSRAVGAAADNALGNYNAKEVGTIEIDLSKADAGKVTAKEYEVEQSGQKGRGFRAEFSCPDGYVLLIGAGADLPVPGGSGSKMFDNVQKLAKSVTCNGG